MEKVKDISSVSELHNEFDITVQILVDWEELDI